MDLRIWGLLVYSSSSLQNAQEDLWQMNHAHGSNREVLLLIWQHSQHDLPFICKVLFVFIFIRMNPMHQALHTITNPPAKTHLMKFWNLMYYKLQNSQGKPPANSACKIVLCWQISNIWVRILFSGQVVIHQIKSFHLIIHIEGWYYCADGYPWC